MSLQAQNSPNNLIVHANLMMPLDHIVSLRRPVSLQRVIRQRHGVIRKQKVKEMRGRRALFGARLIKLGTVAVMSIAEMFYKWAPVLLSPAVFWKLCDLSSRTWPISLGPILKLPKSPNYCRVLDLPVSCLLG